MKLNDKITVEGHLLHKKNYLILFAVVALISVSNASVSAQTLPDTPFDDTQLVDPDQTDFPDSTFTDDFSSVIGQEDLLGAGDTTTDPTDATATTDPTASVVAPATEETPATDPVVTETPVDTVTTTIVSDTPTGPGTVFIFWLTFIISFGILQIIRVFSKDHQ